MKQVFAVIALLAGLLLGAPTASALTVRTSLDANENSGLEVDVVFVYATEAADQLTQISSAEEWFAEKQQLMDAYQGMFQVVSLQLPPSTLSYVALPQRAPRAITVLLFAHYQTPGEHRIEIGLEDDIVFGRDDIE